MPSPQPKLITAAPAVRRALLGWFRRAQRPLPWRTEVSVYRTVVSELMCQQTQVATVLPYFERWVAQWPSWAALARAQEADVLALWAGLGYYTRARSLLGIAQQVVAQGSEPRTAAAWQAFKGVGPYTAAAIGSIAFQEPVAVVDGNVVRVLARLTGWRERIKDAATAAKILHPLAQQLVHPQRPGDYNQALMELGATVCRKAAPACSVCPLAPWCEAFQSGHPETIPRFEPKVRRTAHVERIIVRDRGKILLHRQPRTARRLAGMAEIPARAMLGTVVVAEAAGVQTRTIGNVIYAERLGVVSATTSLRKRWTQVETLEWVAIAALPTAALTGPHLRWLRAWLSRADQPTRGTPP